MDKLEDLLCLDFDVLKTKGISDAMKTLLDAVNSNLNEACDSGSLDEVCSTVLATMPESLRVLHDFLEKAVMSKYAIVNTPCMHRQWYIQDLFRNSTAQNLSFIL